ncbi:MAG: hypothetical protein JWP35_2250 [Caulobacter sp.]|nr:hypothetical protein [Caulobacter sp.]
MMTARLRRLCAPGLALTLALTAAQPVLAANTTVAALAGAPAGKPIPESERMSRYLVHAVLADAESYKPFYDMLVTMTEAEIRKDGIKQGGYGSMAYARFSGWTRLFGDAAWEEFLEDRPLFEDILSRYMAQRFTLGELRAATALCEEGFLSELRPALVANMSNLDSDLVLSPKARKALDKFNKSSDGRSFIAKLRGIAKDESFQPVSLELIAVWVPGAARRWGEKTQAAEAARRAAS